MGARWRRRPTRCPRGLYRVFDRSEASLGPLPIRKTICGTWVPTPMPILETGLALLRERGVLDAAVRGAPVVDAGTGDGRLPAVLSRFGPRVEVHGIELDPTLCALARRNLEELAARRLVGRVHTLEADYCAVATYDAAGLSLQRLALVFNYPDGNQHRLAAFLRRHGGPELRLCVVTHDRTLEIDELPLRLRCDLPVAGEPAWRISVYGHA